eukprot:PITA_21493
MASSGKIEIEKFNGQSFELWKLKMEELLVDKDQWIAVDPGTKPTGVTDEEWKKLDRKAKSTIRLCVSDSVLLNVSGEATAKALWTISALLTEEMRRKNMDNQNGDALFVRGRSQNRNTNKSSSWRSKSRGRSKSPGKPTKVVCWKCEKEGHLRRECKSKALDKGKGSDDAPSAEAKTTSDEGDDRKARIIGRGKVKLKLQGGRVTTLPGVLHIPALARNLISVSKSDDAGVKTVFENDTCKMVRGALVLMRGVRIGTLYKLQDDFSRNTWIYFLKKKSEVFDRFKEFKALVENQTEKKIKVLRTDNGGEFCSKEFEEFCKKCGIARQKTTPYTPQQNGVAERMNKTLMERARSMLSGAGLGQEFWAEAVDTACYLVNRSPSSALEDKTPQEGYKLWKPVTRKVVYSRDVVFREVKDVIKHEFQPKEPMKIEFELKEEESGSIAEEESEDEEPQTPAVRRSARERRQPERYSPYAFYSNFALSVTDDDPRTVKEAMDSEDGKLWKEAMVDKMASLHKNEAWDLV